MFDVVATLRPGVRAVALSLDEFRQLALHSHLAILVRPFSMRSELLFGLHSTFAGVLNS
jgi:hypothetical protein